MSFEPKKFQEATIDAVVTAFNHSGSSRRFLVADEAGLGKTVVARGVIKKLMSPTKPLTVFYVCSNQAIASQNVDQLLSALLKDERQCARTHVDRPSLLPLSELPTSEKLRVFSLTPGTAFSLSSMGTGRGHYQERALACALVEHVRRERLPALREKLEMKASRFGDWVDEYERRLNVAPRQADPLTVKIVEHFRRTLRHSLGVGDGERLLPKLQALILDPGNALASRLRNAVSCAALEALDPDLIIFDEFQRFRDVMRQAMVARAQNSQTPQQRLQARLLEILTAGHKNARLLLLSATPYEAERNMPRQPKTGLTLMQNQVPESDFFEVLDFLGEGSRHVTLWRSAVRDSFAVIDRELRKGQPLSDDARCARADLTKNLMRVMCRTERPRIASREAIHKVVEQDARVEDIQVFREFSDSVSRAHLGWTVPLWSSVPAPVQTLGASYACWPAEPNAQQSTPVLSAAEIEAWAKPRVWPSPKLRSLLSTMVPGNLEMPWIRPSRPWWSLKGGWLVAPGEQECDGKMLVFSRFAAAPSAISGLVSYSLESNLFVGRKPTTGYSQITRGSKFKPGGQSPGMFQLFFLSPFLAELDPLKEKIPGTARRALMTVERQLRAGLKQAFPGVLFNKKRKAKLIPLHVLLIAIAKRRNEWPQARLAWIDALTQRGEDNGKTDRASVEAMLDQWEALVPVTIDSFHEAKELRPLAVLALGSPAAVVARALRRHRIDAFDPTPSQYRNLGSPASQLQRLLLNGFRRYFDKPWFAAALARGSEKQRFPKVLIQAVIDGNLEATLDEHFWLLNRTSSGDWPSRLEELTSSLNVEGGWSTFHERGKGSETTRVRCHVALPLRPAKSQDGGARNDVSRPDQIRHAFNTPFWPFILTTTSVGQEGLDFHFWCRTIGHWDLAPGPVELEQREGRVSRFTGLSVRRALAGNSATQQYRAGESPWTAIESVVAKAPELLDEQELSPWWHLPDAHTRQYYFPTSGSREIQQLKTLERRRALYRMVFGAADPEHLLGELDANAAITPEIALQSSLRLSAWEEATKKAICDPPR